MPDPPSVPSVAPRRSLPDTEFDPAAAERYSRQILFPGIGVTGQQRLRAARVAILGVGATGATLASLLARAGVGYLRLIDRDFVEPSNLQRQILFDEADAEAVLPKAEAAHRKLRTVNSGVLTDPVIADLVPANATTLLGGVDLLLDATDNFETRYLINDFAVLHGIPWIYSAAVGAYAATMNILPRPATPLVAWPTEAFVPTACLACIFPEPPSGHIATCDTAGILAGAVNLAASLQSIEALKLLSGQPHLMRRTLVSFDLWNLTTSGALTRAEIIAGTPDPDCPVCGHRRFTHLTGSDRPEITLCGRNAVQIHERGRPLALTAVHARLRALPEISDLRSNGLLLRFRRGEQTVTLFNDGRAVIQGTTDPAVARSLYARFIGS